MAELRNRSQCLCSACGLIFTGVTAFDRHQTGIDPVVCHDPVSRGLELRPGGVWGKPGGSQGTSKALTPKGVVTLPAGTKNASEGVREPPTEHSVAS